MPPNKKIQGNNLKIIFQSDDNIEKRGFNIGINTILNVGDQMDCNFDFGFCNGWRNNPMSDPNLFNWQLGLGPTTTIETGPSIDHSTVEGRVKLFYRISEILPKFPIFRTDFLVPKLFFWRRTLYHRNLEIGEHSSFFNYS